MRTRTSAREPSEQRFRWEEGVDSGDGVLILGGQARIPAGGRGKGKEREWDAREVEEGGETSFPGERLADGARFKLTPTTSKYGCSGA